MELPFTEMGKTMRGVSLGSRGNRDMSFEHSKFEKPGRGIEWAAGYSCLWFRGENMLEL